MSQSIRFSGTVYAAEAVLNNKEWLKATESDFRETKFEGPFPGAYSANSGPEPTAADARLLQYLFRHNVPVVYDPYNRMAPEEVGDLFHRSYADMPSEPASGHWKQEPMMQKILAFLGRSPAERSVEQTPVDVLLECPDE